MDPYQNRRWVIVLVIISVSLIFSLRLLYIQVIDKEWSNRAQQISYIKENLQPPRGFIYDRYQELLVGAENVYDIYILPVSVKEKDSSEICDIFQISREELREKILLASTGYNVPTNLLSCLSLLVKRSMLKLPFVVKGRGCSR